MTREPDRFEASCGVHGQRSWWRDGHCICAELRAAESSALERAAQEYGAEDLANIKVYCRHVAQRLRALASPAAAPAPEKSWTVKLSCCGRDDGTFSAATWAEADAFREHYLNADGHKRSAIIVSAEPAAPAAETEKK